MVFMISTFPPDNSGYNKSVQPPKNETVAPAGDIIKATTGCRWDIGNTLTKWGNNLTPSKFLTYEVVPNKGVNTNGARKTDICLANYSQKVADDISTLGACYTGVKRALWQSGVVPEYKTMPGSKAHQATEYFDSHPEQFKKLKDVTAEGLKKLPAGRIIVYKKDGETGHIAITNGYGQETSDCTDNMKWLEAKGKGSTYSAYELTDRWQYNPQSKKLEFK